MITTPAERRRAEEFDALLSSDRPGQVRSHGEQAGLVTLASALRDLDFDAGIDPVFSTRLRQRLVAVANVRGIGREPQFRPLPAPVSGLRSRMGGRMGGGTSRRVPRRTAIAGLTLAGLVALSGVGMASGTAQPGDALYGVKRSREAAQLALARSDVSRGQLHLEFARNRLEEAAAVVDDPAESTELTSILDEMDADSRTGMRELGGSALAEQAVGPLDIVDSFSYAQNQRMSELAASAAGPARTRLLRSLALLDAIDTRSAGLRSTLRCSGTIAEEGGQADELGPTPRRCLALPAGTATDPGQDPATRGTTPGPSVKRSGPASPSETAGQPGPTGTTRESAPPSGATPSQQSESGPDAVADAPPAPTGEEPLASPPTGTNDVLDGVSETVGGVVDGLLGGPAPLPPVPSTR